MPDAPIRETSRLQRDDWGAFFSTFSTENRGQPIAVEVMGEDVGDQPLFKGPLLAIAYDPAGKGDDLVITIGEKSAEHVIESPTEVWLARNANGQILSLEVVSADGRKTLVTL